MGPKKIGEEREAREGINIPIDTTELLVEAKEKNGGRD